MRNGHFYLDVATNCNGLDSTRTPSLYRPAAAPEMTLSIGSDIHPRSTPRDRNQLHTRPRRTIASFAARPGSSESRVSTMRSANMSRMRYERESGDEIPAFVTSRIWRSG